MAIQRSRASHFSPSIRAPNFAYFSIANPCLYPMVIRVIAGVILRPLAGILSDYCRALLAGCFLSSLRFCFSAVVLNRLWMRLTHRVSSSSFIIALALINPATVFLTSCFWRHLSLLLCFRSGFQIFVAFTSHSLSLNSIAFLRFYAFALSEF